MATRLRGRWALGITPRNFTWILRDKLAICERPGGYGENHRRVRRQEEIIWIRENGFGCVISIIPAPHNLHNYEELGVTSPDGKYTVIEVECLGACGFATPVMINEEFLESVTPETVPAILASHQ